MFCLHSFVRREFYNFRVRNALTSWSYRNVHTGISVSNETKSDAAEESIKTFQQLNLKALANVYDKINFENISIQEGQHLLQCCGTSSINSTLEERNQMCKNVFENLVKYEKLNLDIYYTYIQTCTDNKTLLNAKTFLENLKFNPDYKIYRFLLENVCECGDLSQAFIILEFMKQHNVPVDENIFNSLVLVHTLKGGLEAGENVLDTMKTAKISETVETYIAILKGIVRSQNYNDLKKFVDKYKFSFDENQILNILKELGVSQNVEWLSEMKAHLSNLVPTREFINNVKNISINLIHLKKSDSAVKLYAYFQQQPEENFGFFILEEMLHSKTDPNEIISTAKLLLKNHNNEQVFKNLTEFALQHKYFEITWRLFENIGELRPHFFWPLLVNAQNNEGETGIFNVIEKINKMGLKLDLDTLEYYILPFCNLEDIASTVEKLKTLNFTLKEVVNTILLVLLKNGQIKTASELFELYNVQIQGEKLFKHICSSWKTTKDSAIVSILQKFCECNSIENDFTGDFLIISLKKCTSIKDYQAFSYLLKTIQMKKLKITVTSADTLREILKKRMGERESQLSEVISDGIDQIIEFKLKTEANYIPHPRTMNLDELECHLVELTQKNMETRGVLRRLIQIHAKRGNLKRVAQLRQQFLDSGYEETLGMQSSLMYTYILFNNLESALDIYKKLKKLDTNFVIDEHKIIDLATVLVKNDKFDEAKSIIEEASNLRLYDGSGLQRNCIELLNSIKDENKQNEMLHFLVAKGLCKFNNVMLGPLVRIHLKSGDLEKASNAFIYITETYKCTPLQYELIMEIAKSKNEELLQKVLDNTSKIHGPLAAQVAFICALAEIGQERILKKILATTQFHIKDEVNKRCVRWIKQGKSEALITLLNSCSRLSNDLIDINFVYESIMKIFAINNDCEGAVKFYEGLLEKEVSPAKTLERQLYILLKQNNYLIPNSLKVKNRT